MKRLRDIGERKAIQKIFEILSEQPSFEMLGDDCAVLEYGDEFLLISTDMIHEHTHIPMEMTPFDVGWFLVAINLSDLAAKGGIPFGVLLSYGLPGETLEEYLTGLTQGAYACVTACNTEILGGDLKEAAQISLCGTAIGHVKKDEFMSRRGMKPGDIVAVTGGLGHAGAGYYALKHHVMEEQLRKHLFRPAPQLTLGRLLAQQHGVTTCMDLSDGLSSSLYQLMEMNQVGFDIYQNQIPISQALQNLAGKLSTIPIDEIVLHFGGDYELLTTISEKAFLSIQKEVQKPHYQLTAIGKVTKEKHIHLINQSKTRILENIGYEHFTPHHF